MAKEGKRITAARTKVDKEQLYDAAAAVALVKESATAKFDETVELHLRTGLDGHACDQAASGAQARLRPASRTWHRVLDVGFMRSPRWAWALAQW